LGKTAKDDILGFLLHGPLSIDFESGMALGFPDIQIWDRGHLGDTTVKERNHAQQPIAEKESNKWLKAVRNSETVLREAASITFVGDRESDIYNLYCCHKQDNANYVARCHFDRKTTTGTTIKEVLAQATEMHGYDLEIMGDARQALKGIPQGCP